jgi:starch-binding outer membrane protein, SusD/RagB family
LTSRLKIKVMKKLNISFLFLGALSCMMMSTGCKKLVQVDAPYTSTSSKNVYTSNATAAAVLTGLYVQLSGNAVTNSRYLTAISLYAGLSADELTLYNGTSGSLFYHYKNALSSTTSGFEFWNAIYPMIYTANSAIEGITGSSELTPKVKDQLTGEAKFIRAFSYFYLVNLYGDVPLVLSTDYTVNGSLSRSPQSQVYQQIIADLHDAQRLLSPEYYKGDASTPYATSSPEKLRPNRFAATALLARTYLYTGNWAGADSAATAVISNPAYALSSLTGANGVFTKNSTEAIWQLQPVNTGWNTEDARTFVLPSTGPTTSLVPVYLSNQLLNSFETNDGRKTNWVNSVTVNSITYYYAYKYKSATVNNPVTEYSTVLRLAEQYLIRAEARAQLNNTNGAKADLDAIRTRAGLPNTTANDKISLLTAILHERQVELFTEWGHRWLDLKRTNTVNTIMSAVTPQKGGTWNSNWQWYPIQAVQIQRAPQLTQNLGY